MPRRACGAAAYTGGQNMRKWIALILVFALCLCAPAWAESVTDALGITGGEEGAVRGDLSARTATDLFVVTNDGSDKVLTLSLIHISKRWWPAPDRARPSGGGRCCSE